MVRCSKLHRYNLIYLRIKKLKLAEENKHTYKSVNGSHAVEQASIWSDEWVGNPVSNNFYSILF